MRRMDKRTILTKRAFLKGVRDAKFGRTDEHIEVQTRLNEIERLEGETSSPKVQKLYREIENIREAYTSAMEMATLQPDKDAYDLLAKYTGEDKDYLLKEMELAIQEEMQRKEETAKKEKKQISKPKVPETKRVFTGVEYERLTEKLKAIGAIVALAAICATVGYVENLAKQDPEKAKPNEKQQEMDKYSKFRQSINQNNGEYTQNDGTTITYNAPDNFKDRGFER